MIKTIRDLRDYIDSDRRRYYIRKPEILGWFLGDESFVVVRYLRVLRRLEYYMNNKRGINNILFYLFLFIHRRNCIKTGIIIPPNVCGKGLYIPHYQAGIIVNAISVGNNCTINSGVVIGNKGETNNKAIIGHNGELTIGSKIIGKVVIGDNVIVAPNSVVIKDVPSNTIVSGVPAKFLKNR